MTIFHRDNYRRGDILINAAFFAASPPRSVGSISEHIKMLEKGFKLIWHAVTAASAHFDNCSSHAKQGRVNGLHAMIRKTAEGTVEDNSSRWNNVERRVGQGWNTAHLNGHSGKCAKYRFPRCPRSSLYQRGSREVLRDKEDDFLGCCPLFASDKFHTAPSPKDAMASELIRVSKEPLMK